MQGELDQLRVPHSAPSIARLARDRAEEYYGIGRGSVVFDGGGRVSSLQAPTPGWSW